MPRSSSAGACSAAAAAAAAAALHAWLTLHSPFRSPSMMGSPSSKKVMVWPSAMPGSTDTVSASVSRTSLTLGQSSQTCTEIDAVKQIDQDE